VWSVAATALCIPLAGPLSRWLLGAPEHATLLLLAFVAVPVGLINTMCSQALRNSSARRRSRC
jgi:hypothetical protein